MTEAVAGRGFLLGCISCKTREEVPARATVDWHFRPPGEEDFRHVSPDLLSWVMGGACGHVTRHRFEAWHEQRPLRRRAAADDDRT